MDNLYNTDYDEEIFINNTNFSEKLFLKTLMENSKDPIYFKDKESRFIYVNRIKSQKHGIKNLSEMIGKSDYDYLPQDVADETFQEERTIMQTGQPIIGKIEKKLEPDGTVKFGSASKYPFYNSEGKIIGTWGITTDITDIQIAREMLLQANERHRKIIENICDIIGILDFNGICKYTSPNVEKEFGWTPDEYLGKSGFDFIHPDDCAHAVRAFESLKVPGSFQTIECRLRCKETINTLK